MGEIENGISCQVCGAFLEKSKGAFPQTCEDCIREEEENER